MQKVMIGEKRFYDSSELKSILDTMAGTILVFDARGNQLDSVRVFEETLTDGSKVINIELSAVVCSVSGSIWEEIWRTNF